MREDLGVPGVVEGAHIPRNGPSLLPCRILPHAPYGDGSAFARDGASAVQMTSAEFADYIKTDVEKWKKVIADAHIKQIE